MASPDRTPRVSAGALVLAAAIPPLFTHLEYQPRGTLERGGVSVTVALSDVAVLAVAVVAAWTARRAGLGGLRAGRAVWVAAGALLAWIALCTLHPLMWRDGYAFAANAVTAAKFAEYAVLALAAPLVLRTLRDVRVVLTVLAGWSALMSLVGVLQFLGLVDEFEGRRPGQREPSFVGIHDFAALSGAALALALVALALTAPRLRDRRVAAVAGVAGWVGGVLSGALSGAIGIVLAAAAAAFVSGRRRTLSLRRAGALALVALTFAGGVLAIRTADLGDLLRFVGILRAEEREDGIQTYAHRSVLAYIGVRIWLDHPVAGVGWQGSGDPGVFAPYLDDARARFPDEPAEAFPSPDRRWGVQNAYVQALADLGVVGFALLAALLASGVWLGLRAALRGGPRAATLGLVGALWILVAASVWIGLGLVAGIPTMALLWLGIGLAATSARWQGDEPRG